MKHEEYREMIELAALNALGGDDLRALSEHLATCDECRAELAELRDAAAMLMYHAEPVKPSPELSARILNISQTMPRPGRALDLETSEDEHKGRRIMESGKLPDSSGFVPQQQTWRQRWSRGSLIGALAAALVLVALAVALIVLWNRNRALQAEMTRLSNRNDEMQAELNRLKQSNDELQAELERTTKQNNGPPVGPGRPPDHINQPEVTTNPREPIAPSETPGAPPPANENYSRVVELTATGVAPRSRARLAYNSQTGVIELTVSDMPPAPAGKAYQLWLLIGGKPVSAGTFSTGPGGRAMLRGQVAADALEASAFAVTLEPAGGSNKPTGPKYLLGSPL